MLLDEKQKPIQLPSTTRHAQLICQTQHAEQDPRICCHILTRENGYNPTEPKHHTLYTGFLQNILLAWFEPSSITETISLYVRIQDLVELHKALKWASFYTDVLLLRPLHPITIFQPLAALMQSYNVPRNLPWPRRNVYSHPYTSQELRKILLLEHGTK